MTYGDWPFSRGVDVRPQAKRYGHVEDPDDEEVDPKILEAEARKRAEERAARGGRGAVSMNWSRDGGFERVNVPYPPENAKPAPITDEEVGFDGMEFQDPPPPPSAINLGLTDIPGSWPAAPNSYSATPPYGPSSPPPIRPQGGSW